MKYKNYKNPHTRDDKIYSRDNMLDMTLRELLNSKNELLAQTRILGIPEDRELSGSENVVHVEAYTREDGTEVKAHWRSKPSGWNSVTNNSSVIDSEGTFINDEDAGRNENSNNAEQYRESEEYKRVYREREKQKSIERKDPKEIAGVTRGDPKTFAEMVQGGVNPSFEYDNEDSGNCQCCVGAAEMRRRGYDVSAVNRNDSSLAEELAHDDFGLWLDPKTGNKCEPYEIDAAEEKCSSYLDKTVQNGERYAFAYYAPEDNIIDSSNENAKISGHVVIVDRSENGELRYYDPQTGEIHIGDDAKAYINSWTAPPVKLSANSQVLRIDDKKINPYYRNGIFVPRR